MVKRRKSKQIPAHRAVPDSSPQTAISRPVDHSAGPHGAEPGAAFGISASSWDSFEPIDVSVDSRREAGASKARTTTTSTLYPPRAPRSSPKRAPNSVEYRRLKAVAKELEKLHRQERILLVERDGLIAQLRAEGESWALLASLTGLSRQALSKRTH
jgi:hypothetical protein